MSRQFPSPGSVFVRYGAIWPIPTCLFRDPSVGAYDSLHLHFGCFPLSFAPPKVVGSRVSLLIHLHARKITQCTPFAVADNVKNNETRGTVFLKYNEGDDFCNILMSNDTVLILVKILPNQGYCSSRVDRFRVY